jgi:hypothetical protein
MKSNRRHELQTNELADALGHMIGRAKPHAWLIVLVVGAVVVLGVVAILIPTRRAREAEAATVSFNRAQRLGDARSLRDFLETHADAAQAPAATLLLAGRLMDEAVRGTGAAGGSGSDAVAQGLVAEARDLYLRVAETDEDLKPLARVGLALATVQQGDLAQGRTALEKVIADWPDSVAAEKARVHLEALADYKPMAFSNEPLEPPGKTEAGEKTEAGQDEPPAKAAQKPAADASKDQPPPTQPKG